MTQILPPDNSALPAATTLVWMGVHRRFFASNYRSASIVSVDDELGTASAVQCWNIQRSCEFIHTVLRPASHIDWSLDSIEISAPCSVQLPESVSSLKVESDQNNFSPSHR